MRSYLIQAYGNRCLMCGKRNLAPSAITIDHKIPISAGGTNDRWNLQPLCLKCNQEKGDSMPTL